FVATASVVELFFSMFRRPGLDIDECQTLLAASNTIIFAFPKSSTWATMTALPVSASVTTVKCDIFSNGASLSFADEKTLRSYLASHIEALEHHYEATKFIRFEGTPEQLPLLKAHLRLERLAGQAIFPSKRTGGNSESFCKAEKRMFYPILQITG